MPIEPLPPSEPIEPIQNNQNPLHEQKQTDDLLPQPTHLSPHPSSSLTPLLKKVLTRLKNTFSVECQHPALESHHIEKKETKNTHLLDSLKQLLKKLIFRAPTSLLDIQKQKKRAHKKKPHSLTEQALKMVEIAVI